MQRVAVLGAGTMGRGIAQVSALAGYDVVLYDIADDQLARALDDIVRAIEKGVARGKIGRDSAESAQERLTLTTDLTIAAHVDLVIEAAPERIDLKQRLFAEIDAAAPAHTILASNTSSFSIDVMASATARPDRFIGLHFFNPAHIMQLVEIIRGDGTSAATVDAARAYVARLGKTGVLVKNTPAFIVNRVARPFYGEAFRLLGEDAATVDQIDRLMRSVGFRMGPLELVDLIGCDVNFAVTQSVYEAYFHDPKYRPHPIQRNMVESGRLGRKTGRGFYGYGEDG